MNAWLRSLNRFSVAILPIFGLAAGCADNNGKASMENPEVAQFIRVMMPEKIQVQRLTRPVSFAADGNADGLEVLLAAYDSAGDNTKLAGAVRFELHEFSPAASDDVGPQIAMWSSTMDSPEKMREHWDRISRYYFFPLRLEGRSTLPPGKYVLTTQLDSPVGDRLFDTYTFEYKGGAAPPVRRLSR